jgi:hypothetical protein
LGLNEKRKTHECLDYEKLRKLYVNVDATNIMAYNIKIPFVKIHDELNVRLLSHWHCAIYAQIKVSPSSSVGVNWKNLQR